MNIVLLEPHEISGQSICLYGYRARHIAKILRSHINDRIKVGIINGMIGYGIIKDINRIQPYSVLLDIVLHEEPPSESMVDIIIALPRPIMFKRVLSQAAALGVGTIFVVNANRVEKSFWEASITADEAWRKHLRQGLEQAVDTRLPLVSFHRGFKPFIELDIPRVKSRYKRMLVAHPECDHTLAEVHDRCPGRTLLAIGPEGGWVSYERERLLEAGFSQFSIGPRILKVDTAVTALHSMVSLLNQL